MSSIWNKIVVLGLAAVLSAPVLAADDAATTTNPDQMQAQANPTAQQDTSAAQQDGKTTKECKAKKSKHAKHKRHHSESKKSVVTENTAADSISTNADANSAAK
jgi:hypothetical protein